jgi:hypothetical protein
LIPSRRAANVAHTMNYKLAYATVREQPRKVIHVLRVLDELLDEWEIGELADEMRERVLAKQGEHDAALVMVQGDSKETLRLSGEPYAVNRVRTAMFNAAVRWRPFVLD